MTVTPIQDIFDLHCDTLTECHKRGVGLADRGLHLCLDKLPAHMRLCQATAIFMPDSLRGEAAEAYFDTLLAVFRQQMLEHGDRVSAVEDAREIPRLLEQKPFAFLLAVEGGSALAGKTDNLYKLRRVGVRMMTLTWNDENEICGGAATDIGFSPFGRQVVPLMEELGIVVDVSHLSDRGFAELCELAGRPFVASHSNARAVCAHRRNLTDGMFAAIRDRGGLVGLNYYNNFLVEEGKTATVADLLRHAHHFLDLGGEDVLALGSDFDGAALPPDLCGLDKLEYVRQALEKSGLPAPVVQKLFFENARAFFARYEGRQPV